LKRLPITIQYKNKPEMVVQGYALTHEILPEQVSFFATQKFPVDEELIISWNTNGGETQSMNVVLRQMHEQISSGRVMNDLPNDKAPFPARKFYRCYTSIKQAQAEKGITENSEGTGTFEEKKAA
jgi:hypothetical protein